MGCQMKQLSAHELLGKNAIIVHSLLILCWLLSVSFLIVTMTMTIKHACLVGHWGLSPTRVGETDCTLKGRQSGNKIKERKGNLSY